MGRRGPVHRPPSSVSPPLRVPARCSPPPARFRSSGPSYTDPGAVWQRPPAEPRGLLFRVAEASGRRLRPVGPSRVGAAPPASTSSPPGPRPADGAAGGPPAAWLEFTLRFVGALRAPAPPTRPRSSPGCWRSSPGPAPRSRHRAAPSHIQKVRRSPLPPARAARRGTALGPTLPRPVAYRFPGAPAVVPFVVLAAPAPREPLSGPARPLPGHAPGRVRHARPPLATAFPLPHRRHQSSPGLPARAAPGGPAPCACFGLAPALDMVGPVPWMLERGVGSDRPNDYIAGFPDHPHRGSRDGSPT